MIPLDKGSKFLAHAKKLGLSAVPVGGIYKGHSELHDIDLLTRESNYDKDRAILERAKRKLGNVGNIDLYVTSDDMFDAVKTMLRSPTYDVINKKMGKGLKYKRHVLADPVIDYRVIPANVLRSNIGSGFDKAKLITYTVPIGLLLQAGLDLRRLYPGFFHFSDPLAYKPNQIVYLFSRVPRGLLEWRRRQKRGRIMKPSTFERIKRLAAQKGYEDPDAVAGAAYWNTARSKYLESRGD